MKKIIQLTVSTNGEYTITPIGFTGPSCLKATKQLEDALGTVDERNRVLLNSYHQDYGVVTVDQPQQQTC